MILGVLAIAVGVVVALAGLVTLLRRNLWASAAESAGVTSHGGSRGYAIMLAVVQWVLAGVLVTVGVSLVQGAPLPAGFRSLATLLKYVPAGGAVIVAVVAGVMAVSGVLVIRSAAREHRLPRAESLGDAESLLSEGGVAEVRTKGVLGALLLTFGVVGLILVAIGLALSGSTP